MATLDPWAPTDPLGEALHLVRMSGAFYCRSELSAPWGLTLPPMPGYLWFHVVTSGSAFLETEHATKTLRHGDMALVSHGAGHVLRSEPGAPAPGILDLERGIVSDRYEILTHGEGGPATLLICGAVRLDHPAAQTLLDVLPEIVHVESSQGHDLAWMQSTLGLLAAETKEVQPGGEAVITRLADIIVIQAIRSWLETDPDARKGWLGALRDPHIGRAIALIHRDPSRQWSIAALADEAAMSRSAFSARFTELVGEPVMQYVTRWRMHLALTALREDGSTVAALAGRLGYRSEAAFARAFKRVTGSPPGAIRREATANQAAA